MKMTIYEKNDVHKGPSTQEDKTVISTEQKSINFIVRKPLLAYFVFSYTFFWGFLF
jgi:hypothetical protein